MYRVVFILLTSIFILGCKTPEARKPVSASSGSFIDESVARNKALNKKERAQIEQLMANDSTKEYIASQSGFWYYYISKVENDSLQTPDFGDLVNFNYNVKSLTGQIIYSENEIKTQEYAMDQEELFSGLREGLKLMKEGETVTFLFPSQKAYGYYGDENKIGTSTPIICQVTVNSITENDNQSN